jgi:polyisoprenoid-binding protein YceI
LYGQFKTKDMKTKFLTAITALALATFTLQAQTVAIDVPMSTIKWEAKKVVGQHNGVISLKSGSLTLKNQNIMAGEFIVDMKTIKDSDLPAGEWNDKLIGHLNSDDFFGTAKFPESKLLILSATPFDAKGNSEIKGKLTIKNIEQPIDFTANVNGKNYYATLTIDRTKYDIKYGSGQFFEGLGDKMISDTFTLEISLITK